jgi:pSer/pThr/pTyr-binding forkhead associated (FHA) protein
MNRSAAALSAAPLEFNLTVMNGKDKGSVYRLMAPEITLGRGSDNDISFPDDPTCSRRHARIFLTPEGFKIEILSDKNSLVVDGRKVSATLLVDGSLIEVGNTSLKFKIQSQALSPVAPASGLPSAPRAGTDVTRVWQGPAPGAGGGRRKKKKVLNPLRVIIGIVALLGLYLAFSDSPKPKKDLIQLRTTEAIKADIEAANKLKESALIEKRQNQTQSQAYQEAQAAYVRGFRDHQKGIYGRAMESFQACLSLVPNHQLCNRYLKLSQRKFNELVQYHMVLGRKYRDQNQFTACASAFSNVMVMIRDQNNKTYQEAKANYDACHTQVEDRF